MPAECNHKFLIRIECTANSHTVLLWNDETQVEETTAEVEFDARVFFDQERCAYVLDNTDGLIDLKEARGASKYLAFRK